MGIQALDQAVQIAGWSPVSFGAVPMTAGGRIGQAGISEPPGACWALSWVVYECRENVR